MKKTICILIILGFILSMVPSVTVACDRYLGEAIRLKVKIKDLQEMERYESNKWQRNKYRNQRMNVIQDARRAEGSYVQCMERRKDRYSRPERQRIKQQQKREAADMAQNYNFDSYEAVEMVENLLNPINW